MTLNIKYGQDNHVFFDADNSFPYYLIEFHNPYTCKKAYAVFQDISEEVCEGDGIVLNIKEKGEGAADPLLGEVVLKPSGAWIVKLYGQASPTNLNPINAEFLQEKDMSVFKKICV